ncbi:hypothetical protein [Haloarcula amylovorans]|uniref:hypothetical protein n=1 Tax=Haloarcula amylovorans TaxID=2562280 RepID=UPI0010760F02|nr:hypothetical protein [Halomicroarcula amylolytica]
MERGTDWEHEAVQKQWAAREHTQRITTRLVASCSLGLFAFLLFLLALASEACLGDAGIPPRCTAVMTGPLPALFGLGGILALGVGLWLCWSVYTQAKTGNSGFKNQ